MFVITGGGSGIGRALAIELASKEKPVLIIGRRENLLQEVAQQSPLINYLSADISLSSGRQKLVDYLKTHDTIDGLIHSAGTIEPVAKIGEIDESAWRKSLETNIDSPLFLTQKLLPKLKNGRVLQIGSGAAYMPISGWTAYCCAKAALSMMVRCWKIENNLTIASVMPGIVATDMLAFGYSDPKKMSDEQYDFYRDLREKNLLLDVDTVASFLSWLLLQVPADEYTAKEWDIYDSSQHPKWLVPPNKVPQWM